MTLIRFEPLRDFDRLSNQIEKYFNDTVSSLNQNTGLPKVDIYETEELLNVEVELPGVEKENIKLTLEDNILTLQGSKKSREIKDLVKSFRQERSFGTFKRSFTLPVDVDPDKVNAKFENGVLQISLQKFDVKNINEKTIELK
ncbi:MAG: Hsp20/alpha crystallin family protein [Melioribacteraceae bacterium]|nr:MAG: Hsp20/alpha crystallin family protein [Melioribacteraceae bacterium]